MCQAPPGNLSAGMSTVLTTVGGYELLPSPPEVVVCFTSLHHSAIDRPKGYSTREAGKRLIGSLFLFYQEFF